MFSLREAQQEVMESFPNDDMQPRYLLGILNSAIVNWFVQTSGTQMESGYFSYEARFIRYRPRFDLSKCPT